MCLLSLVFLCGRFVIVGKHLKKWLPVKLCNPSLLYSREEVILYPGSNVTLEPSNMNEPHPRSAIGARTS